jgi:hypothetical protein
VAAMRTDLDAQLKRAKLLVVEGEQTAEKFQRCGVPSSRLGQSRLG